MIVFTVASPVTGLALDRFGARATFSVGAALLALGLFSSSQTASFWQLALTYGVVAGLGITVLGLGQQTALVARWFRRRRGLAIGLAFAGTGLGALLLVPFTQYLIENWSWRSGFFVLGLLAAATIPLILLLVRDRPTVTDVGRTSSGKMRSAAQLEGDWGFAEAARTRRFWLVLLAALGAMAPIRMLTVHQLAIMNDAGIALRSGAAAIGLAGLITAMAFILSGALSDRIGRVPAYALGGVSILVSLYLLGNLDSESPAWILWLYAIGLGLGEGSRSSLVTAAMSDLFPGEALGVLNGAVGSAFGAGAALFPWLAGYLYDRSDSYVTALWLAGLMVIVSVVSLFLASRLATMHRNHKRLER